VIVGDDGGSRRPGDTARCIDRAVCRVASRRGRQRKGADALSPDERWVLYQHWASGSWDIRAVERHRTLGDRGRRPRQRDGASWIRRRTPRDVRIGLAPRPFGGAIYSVPFAPLGWLAPK
jgi:hypothetical protein